MAIFRWGANFDPLVGLRYVQRELERLARPWSDQTRRIGGGVFPSVNVFESAKEVLIQCEVPGIEQKDLDVTITGETLTVKGVKHPLPDEENLNFIRRERGSGQFTRTVILPDAVDAEKIEASLADGIMTIRLPKKAAAKPKQIEIKAK